MLEADEEAEEGGVIELLPETIVWPPAELLQLCVGWDASAVWQPPKHQRCPGYAVRFCQRQGHRPRHHRQRSRAQGVEAAAGGERGEALMEHACGGEVVVLVWSDGPIQ